MSIFLCEHCHKLYDNDYFYCEETDDGKAICEFCLDSLPILTNEDQQESK